MSRTTHLHVDYVVRHNAVGWPLTDQVNAFTASLGVYPVIATGLLAHQLSAIANVMPAPPLPFLPAEQHGGW
jgi:hypothetical protein